MIDNIEKIKKLSRRLKKILIIILIIIPFLLAGYWIFYNNLPSSAKIKIEHKDAIMNFTTQSKYIRTGGFLAGMLPLSVVSIIILTLIKLLKLYENGDIFTEKNVRYYKKLGKLIIIWSVVNFIYRTLIALILTLPNQPGNRILQLSLESSDAVTVIIGIIALIIANVMEYGKTIEEEQKLTI